MGVYTIDHIYWAIEPDGFLNLTAGVPVPMGAGDTHQGFNPIHGNIKVPYPVPETEYQRTCESLEIDMDLSFTKEIKVGTGNFPNDKGMSYRDPFFQMCAFTHKAITGTWSGGAATYGKITGDFSAMDKLSSIMIQFGKAGGAQAINKCLNGVLISNYKLGFAKGNLLREFVDLDVAFASTNTQAFVPNASYDDGRWAKWAVSGETFKKYMASVCNVYWDDAHVAKFQGLKLEEFWMELKMPQQLDTYHDKLYAQQYFAKNRDCVATVKAILVDKQEFEECISQFESKTKKDLRLTWDERANETKWMQLKSAHFEALPGMDLTEKQEGEKVSFSMRGRTAEFEGNYENLPTPVGRITA